MKAPSDLRIRSPEFEFVDTTPNAQGWVVSGNVEFAVEDAAGSLVASLMLPFENATNERDALGQAAEQLLRIANSFAAHAHSFLSR